MSVYRDYGFPLTSVEGDRTYGSADWRKYFSSLITDGVIAGIGDEVEVVASSPAAKSVVVSTGAVNVSGAIREIEAAQTLALADNTSGSTRVDRIIARYSDGDRLIEFAVVEGTPGAGAPALSSGEISLARVSLANGYSTVVAGNITDERDYSDYTVRPPFYKPREEQVIIRSGGNISQIDHYVPNQSTGVLRWREVFSRDGDDLVTSVARTGYASDGTTVIFTQTETITRNVDGEITGIEVV